MRTLRGAFTLIELLIVLVIIGVIYSLAASMMRPPSEPQAQQWSLERLAETLRSAGEGYLKLRCGGDACQSCALYNEAGETLLREIPLFRSLPIVHRFDDKGYLEAVSFAPGVCFEMERFENGSVSELLVEYENQFYRYYPLIHSTKMYVNFEDAKNSLDASRHLPTDRGRYFHERD